MEMNDNKDPLEFSLELIAEMRKTFMDKIASDILSVQPMSPTLLDGVFENAKTRDQLITEGYKPVSQMGLMWIKKEAK